MQTGALTPDHATPGRILAAARTERGMSISEVAQRLKFSLRHIEALEADRYEALPSGPFVRGMVRTYAKLLGVDPARLLEDLPQPESAGEPAMQPRDMSVPFPQESRPGSRIYLLLSMLIIVAVVVVLAEWFIRSQRGGAEDAALSPPTVESASKADSSTTPVPLETASTQEQPAAADEEMAPQPTPETTIPAPAPPMETTSAALQPETGSPAPAASIQELPTPSGGSTGEMQAEADRTAPPASQALPPGDSRLQFTFESESWVEVKDANGDVIFSAINPAGTEKQVVGTPPFSLVVGNASGVRLLYNGEPVALKPHRTSDVARVTLE